MHFNSSVVQLKGGQWLWNAQCWCILCRTWFLYSFNCTTEELKFLYVFKSVNNYFLLIVPLRNWNRLVAGFEEAAGALLIVPLRNWNKSASDRCEFCRNLLIVPLMNFNSSVVQLKVSFAAYSKFFNFISIPQWYN